MKRVEVTLSAVGIFAMQVCAVEDASDEEILRVCNHENPAGTTHGWQTVVRREVIEAAPDQLGYEPNKLPIKCKEHEGRMHFLVYC